MCDCTEDKLLLRNLKDAGCDAYTAEKCCQLQRDGNRQALLRALSAHKASLLNQMHACQRRIDCLDYLVYEMEKEGK